MQLAMTFKQLKQQVELSPTVLTIAVYLFFLADIIKKLGNTTIAAGIVL